MLRRNFLTGLFVAPVIIPAPRLMRLSPVKIERWMPIPDPGRGQTHIATTQYVQRQITLWEYSLQGGRLYQRTPDGLMPLLNGGLVK